MAPSNTSSARHFPARAAAHNTTLPFTRNVVGVMDYTPVTFTDHKFKRTTTDAHELAQSVVFTTGRSAPRRQREGVSGAPAGAEGVPEGRAFGVGRDARAVRRAEQLRRRRAPRSRRRWYVGGLNADKAQTARVNLEFPRPGLVSDDADSRRRAGSRVRQQHADGDRERRDRRADARPRRVRDAHSVKVASSSETAVQSNENVVHAAMLFRPEHL